MSKLFGKHIFPRQKLLRSVSQLKLLETEMLIKKPYTFPAHKFPKTKSFLFPADRKKLSGVQLSETQTSLGIVGD